MSYKRRLVDEYADLREKIHKLDDYLAEHYEDTRTEIEQKKYDLMSNQLESMNEYYDYLIKRILLEMEEEE